MLKSFMFENLLSLLGLRVKWWPWLCLSSLGMASVWSTIYHRGLCWRNWPMSSDTHTGHVYLHSPCVCVCVFICVWVVTQTASQTLDTSVIQSSGGGGKSRTGPHRCPYGGISQALGHCPLLPLSCCTSGGRGKREQNTDYVFICRKKAEYFYIIIACSITVPTHKCTRTCAGLQQYTWCVTAYYKTDDLCFNKFILFSSLQINQLIIIFQYS